MAGKLAARLASMSAAERARLLAGIQDANRPAGPVRRPRPGGRAAASFLQEQLWFLHHFAAGEPAYNIPFCFRLRGPLQAGALRGAVRDLLARHEALRTRFELDGGQLIQVIAPAADGPDLPLAEVPGATPQAREAAAWQRVRALARTRFDLAAGPLCRAELLRIGPRDHLLGWVSHHAVVDGWSVGLIVDDLRACYQARLGQAAPPPAPLLQFADVAGWQRDLVTGDRLAALLEHWRRRLDGLPPGGLPADFPRTGQQAFAGASAPVTLSADLAHEVAALARRAATTVSAVLLAAFQALLASYAGARDIVVGVPFAGRSRPDLEAVVGPLSNALPVRVSWTGDPAYGEILDRVSSALSEAEAHQDVPFARLAGELAGRRDPSRNPVFQVVFNLGTVPQGSDPVTLSPGLTLEPGGQPNGTARLDLELMMESTAGRLHGRLDYNVALFRGETVRRIAGELADLLASVTTDPGRRLSQLPVAGRRAALAARGLAGGRWPAREITDWLAG